MNDKKKDSSKVKSKNIFFSFGYIPSIITVAIFAVLAVSLIFFYLDNLKIRNEMKTLKELNNNIFEKLESIETKVSSSVISDEKISLEEYKDIQKELNDTLLSKIEEPKTFKDALDTMYNQYNNFSSNMSNLLIFIGTIITVITLLFPIFSYLFLNKDLVNRLQEQIDEANELANDAKKYSQISSLYTEANAEEESSEKIKILSKIILIDENNQSAYNNRGNIYLRNKEYINAINNYTRAIEINKKDDKEDIDKMHSELYNRANAYYLNKNYKNAIEDYNLLINRNPTNAKLICKRAAVKFDNEDYDGAIEDYSMVINVDPELTNPYKNRGKVYIKLKDYDRAINDFKKATKLNPGKSLYNVLGFTYFLKKSFDEAIDCFTKAIEFLNDDSLPKLKKGKAIFEPINLSLLDEKSEKFDSFFSEKKDNSEDDEIAFNDFSESYKFSSPLINRANAYRASGKYKKAIEDYTKAIVQKKLENIDYYNRRGIAYGLNKEYQKSMRDFSKAIELDPENSLYYYNRGIAYELNKNYKKALTNFTKAIELNPEYANAYNNCGIAYIKMKEYEKAIENFSKAIGQEPKNANFYNNRGIAYVRAGKYEEAIEDYNKAIEFDSEYKGAYYNRGIAYAKRGGDTKNIEDYNRAIKDYTKAIEPDSKNANYYSNRGIAYVKRGRYTKNLEDYDRAIKDYTKAIELDSKNANFYKNRGKAYRCKKEYESAEKDYNKAVELDPSFNSYNSRASLYREMGENAKDDKNRENLYNKALSDAEKAIELNPDYSYGYGTLAEIYISMGNDEEFYKNLELALSKKYPLIKTLEKHEDTKKLYDKYKDQEEFKALMKKYNIDYK